MPNCDELIQNARSYAPDTIAGVGTTTPRIHQASDFCNTRDMLPLGPVTLEEVVP